MKKDIDLGFKHLNVLQSIFITSCFLISLSLGSCKVQVVPASSSTMITQVVGGEGFTELLYEQIQASSDKRFVTYFANYNSVDSIITSILKQDSARAKSGVLLSQVSLLQKNFRNYIAYHKAQVILNNSQLKLYELQLDAFWQAILVSEKSYK